MCIRDRGEEVHQKGSNITPERLRFDFTFGRKMTPEEIRQVEDLVNEAIRADAPVSYEEMSAQDALASGAMGLFEERYGDKVRVYTLGDFSKEICGGPHADRTGQLGRFKIQKEVVAMNEEAKSRVAQFRLGVIHDLIGDRKLERVERKRTLWIGWRWWGSWEVS